MKKFLGAAVLMVVGLGILSADEFRVRITKVEGDKLHVEKFAKGAKKGDKGEETTLTAAKDVKVTRSKINPETKKFERGDALPEGLKHEMFSSPKGVGAMVVTNDDGQVTEIRVFGGKGGKKKKDVQ
jgi:hypothetical protein